MNPGTPIRRKGKNPRLSCASDYDHNATVMAIPCFYAAMREKLVAVSDEFTKVLEDGREEGLPIGYRFFPTDKQLVTHYLSNNTTNKDWIADVDVYGNHPDTIVENNPQAKREGVWYFFTNRPNRKAAHGYWKSKGPDKVIYDDDDGGAKIGSKKSLVYYDGNGSKTNWIMEVYAAIQHDMKVDEHVLCKIYKKGQNLTKEKVVYDQQASMSRAMWWLQDSTQYEVTEAEDQLLELKKPKVEEENI